MRSRSTATTPAHPAHDRSPDRVWWLSPLLFSAFPVLFLFTENIGEQVAVEPLLAPLAVALAGGILLTLVVRVLTGAFGVEPSRAGLASTALVLLFFSYGHAWNFVGPTIGSHVLGLAAWAAVAAIAIGLALWIPSAGARSAARGLAFAGGVLVVWNAVPVVQFAWRMGEPAPSSAAASAPNAPERGSLPDIWYLVFDRYAGQRALDTVYGFDNRGFLAELEARGFFVAEDATANYLKTGLSLLSTLNMDYLDADALAQSASAADDWTPVYRALQGSHAVERILHEHGYVYYHLGVRRGATYTNAAADRVLLVGSHTEFSAVLLETTLLRAVEALGTDDGPGGLAGVYADQTRYQFNVLETMARAPGGRPRFVFAHFLLPHSPYVFNADGSWVTPEQAAARSEPEAYLAQVQYANRRILELLDELPADPDSEEAPVILIQADEGPFPERYARDEEGFAWLEATSEELLQKFSILAAYRVPGHDLEDRGLRDDTTAVNSFRLILGAVLGAELPLLPDRNWVFVDQRHLYQQVDVTDQVQGVR